MELETNEALNSAFMPEDPKEFLKKVTELQDVNEDNSLTSSQYKDLKVAMHERNFGKYREDLDAFTHRLK